MSENISIINDKDVSFFYDKGIPYSESGQNIKNITKNSSNPEKIYDSLNNEIKKYRENSKDISDMSDSKMKQDITKFNDKFLDSKYWGYGNEEESLQSLEMTNKYNQIKLESINKNKYKQITRYSNSSENDDYEDDESDLNEYDENSSTINKVSSINIKYAGFSNLNIINSSLNNNNNNLNTINKKNIHNSPINRCITEPDDHFLQRPSFPFMNYTPNKSNNNIDIFNSNMHYPIHSFGSIGINLIPNINNNTNFNKESFISSTNHSSIKYNNASNEDLATSISCEDYNNNNNNENNINFCNMINPNSFSNEKIFNDSNKAKISTSESYEPSLSSSQFHNLSNINNNLSISNNNYDEQNMRKLFSMSFNESNFRNKFYKQQQNQCCSNRQFNKNITYQNKGEKQLINLEHIISGKDKRTTVMIRNIPIKYTDDMLFKELKEFEGKFDCLYMPYDFEKGGNKGYAFINFVNPFHILLFNEKFQKKTWTHFESKKICELNSANFQGIAEIQKHAKNYKGLKKPKYYNINDNKLIEVPIKYLSKFKSIYPHINIIEKNDIFVIVSFN